MLMVGYVSGGKCVEDGDSPRVGRHFLMAWIERELGR